MQGNAIRGIRGVLLMVVASLFCGGPLAKAEPLLSKRYQSEGFVFFQDSRDTDQYYYVPRGPRVSRTDDGRAEFRFVKYTEAGEDESAQSRGGLVHFLVEWGLDEEGLQQARQALARVASGGEIIGPVPFKEGKFNVVSASAGEDGVFNRQIVGEGKAPLLPGHKAAVSIALTPAGATVLWEAFKEGTSDVSVNFLMKFEGLAPAYEARVEVDWDRVYKHHDFQFEAGGQYAWFEGKVGIQAVLDELRQEGAITVEKIGKSAKMDEILNVAYEHIIDQMFEPRMVPPDAASNPQPLTSVVPSGQGPQHVGHYANRVDPFSTLSSPSSQDRHWFPWSFLAFFVSESRADETDDVELARKLPILDHLPLGGVQVASNPEDRWGESNDDQEQSGSESQEGDVWEKPSKEDGSSESTTQPNAGGGSEQQDEAGPSAALSVEVGYAFRRIRNSGHYEIDLRQQLREERELTMAGNIGGFLEEKDPGDRRDYLLEVDLNDPFFRDRVVEVLLDGQDYQDLKSYVNAVEVQLKREHEGGKVTEGNVRFTAEEFAEKGNRLSWTYPRLGDKAGDWSRYDYRVLWSFHGGVRIDQDWQSTTASVLTLSSPLEYKTLSMTVSGEDLRKHGVRTVVAQIRNEVEGKTLVEDVIFNYSAGDPLTKEYRYLAESITDGYEVRSYWVREDGREIKGEWQTRQSPSLVLTYPSG